MLGMGLLWIAAIAALVFGVRFVLNSASGRRGSLGDGETLLEILRRRYARGEIDLTKSEKRLKQLS